MPSRKAYLHNVFLNNLFNLYKSIAFFFFFQAFTYLVFIQWGNINQTYSGNFRSTMLGCRLANLYLYTHFFIIQCLQCKHFHSLIQFFYTVEGGGGLSYTYFFAKFLLTNLALILIKSISCYFSGFFFTLASFQNIELLSLTLMLLSYLHDASSENVSLQKFSLSLFSEILFLVKQKLFLFNFNSSIQYHV